MVEVLAGPFLAGVFGAAFVAAAFFGGIFLVAQLSDHTARKTLKTSYIIL